MSRAAGAMRQKYRNPYAYGESPDPSATPDTGYTYTNDVGGRTELMYMDDTGAEIQITKAGALNVSAATSFPLLAPGGAVGAPSYSFSGGATFSNTGMWLGAASDLRFSVNGADALRVRSAVTSVPSTGGFGWESGAIGSGVDTLFVRDGAGSVGQRNTTNAQTFAVYSTYTAGTPDYERMEFFWTGNTAVIRTAASGTGSARSLVLRYGGTASQAIQVQASASADIILAGTTISTAISNGRVSIARTASCTATSGTHAELSFPGTFSDGGTTSTTLVNVLSIAPTINYTAASRTGKAVLAYFAPVLTSQPSGTNAGISFSSAFASSTFPAMRFHNQADEDTNLENFECGWHLASNIFAMRTQKGGSGTLRAFQLLYAGTAVPALTVPAATTSTVQIAGIGATGSAGTRVQIHSTSVTATSGTDTALLVSPSWAPSSTSTMVAYGVQWASVVNYSNGTPGAGKVYGIYMAPVLTAQPTGNNGGIVFSSAFTSSTFPAMRFHNVADEDTNSEWCEMGWHITANRFTIRTNKLGTGTTRSLSLGYSGGSTALLVPGSATASVDIATGLTAASATTWATVGSGSSWTATSGSSIGFSLPSSFAPSSTSTMAGVGIAITPTINYSNGTPGAGYVQCVRIAPINTALPTGRSSGLNFASTASGLTAAMSFENQADDQTNYESALFGWVSNSFIINVTKGGSGAQRSFGMQVGGSNIWSSSAAGANTFGISSSSSAFVANLFRTGSTTTSGTVVNIDATSTFSDGGTNSTTVVYVARIAPTINYTAGSKTGSVYGMYIVPVNTALPTGLTAGIALASTASALTGGILWHNQADETTNFEYVYEKFTSNVWTIGSVKGGTGTLRGLCLGIAGNSIGFYGVTPVARPAAYTLNATVVTSRTLLASASATATNCNNVIAQMIQDLQAVGLFQ